MRYYEISESTARLAKQMNSFNEYKEGSATDEYRKAVDEVFKLVDVITVKRPENAERAVILADRYAKKLADWINKNNRIRTMCPSVMISGAGNFPVAKKQKQNEATERHYRELDQVTELKERIERLLTSKPLIKAGDENAIEKLQEKLEKAEALQAKMKEVNAYYRKHKTLKGYGEYTDEKAAELDKAIEENWYGAPFAPFQLRNNNAKIKSTKNRIAQLQRLKNAPETAGTDGADEYATPLFKIAENTEIMRLQLFFDGKPDADVRAVLKKNGFRWSPTNEAWQRQLTDNAKYALKRVIEELNG